ncbi:MAG TPA: ISL3 family transposase [candidate division Zixibacteria bacterium]|nr:ISL3 family transposase [candidate division Zixibacteria bacterium]
MSSPIEALFAQALGLEAPWQVVRISFSESEKKLDIYLDFPRGSRFTCPKCGRKDVTAYDTHDKSWRHLNFFQHQAYLHAPEPRVNCPACGVKNVKLSWARPVSGFSLLFEALIMMLATDMPVAAIARLLGEHDTRIWRVIRHYVDEARKQEVYLDTHRIGIDETSRKRGHHYVSLFVDFDQSKVIFATEGRSKKVIGQFSNDFHDHGGDPDLVREVCCDMSPAFIEGIEHCLPNARITFDRFHVMKIMNEAVDKVRREEQKEFPALKKSRWIWLKNAENLTVTQQERFEYLFQLNLKTAQAYQIKLNLRQLWKLPLRDAMQYLLNWITWALTSGLEPVMEAARTILRHWEGIVAFAESRISNGILEGINSLVQAARNKARGYRTVEYFITMIYLIAGNLNFRLPT